MIRITVIIFERLWDNLSKFLFNQTLLLKWHKPWVSVEATFTDTEAVNLSDKPNFCLIKLNLNTKLHKVKLLKLKQMLWNVTENVISKTFKPTFQEFWLLCKRVLGFYHNPIFDKTKGCRTCRHKGWIFKRLCMLYKE